ncbi:MAG: hypothetical protein ACRD5H_01960 [Nitrososphaerales archaeon]
MPVFADNHEDVPPAEEQETQEATNDQLQEQAMQILEDIIQNAELSTGQPMGEVPNVEQ